MELLSRLRVPGFLLVASAGFIVAFALALSQSANGALWVTPGSDLGPPDFQIATMTVDFHAKNALPSLLVLTRSSRHPGQLWRVDLNGQQHLLPGISPRGITKDLVVMPNGDVLFVNDGDLFRYSVDQHTTSIVIDHSTEVLTTSGSPLDRGVAIQDIAATPDGQNIFAVLRVSGVGGGVQSFRTDVAVRFTDLTNPTVQILAGAGANPATEANQLGTSISFTDVGLIEPGLSVSTNHKLFIKVLGGLLVVSETKTTWNAHLGFQPEHYHDFKNDGIGLIAANPGHVYVQFHHHGGIYAFSANESNPDVFHLLDGTAAIQASPIPIRAFSGAGLSPTFPGDKVAIFQGDQIYALPNGDLFYAQGRSLLFAGTGPSEVELLKLLADAKAAAQNNNFVEVRVIYDVLRRTEHRTFLSGSEIINRVLTKNHVRRDQPISHGVLLPSDAARLIGQYVQAAHRPLILAPLRSYMAQQTMAREIKNLPEILRATR